MDLFGRKTRKNKKNFEREINLAITNTLDRYGSANAEHFNSYLRLKEISNHKINPNYSKTNYWQQAGFSSEIKNVARHNARSHLQKSNNMRSRTDDIGSVNHPKYDSIDINKNGKAIIDKNGNFVNGAQQKNFEKVSSYRKLYGSEYEHYEGAYLDIPSNMKGPVDKDWENRIAKLEKQKQTPEIKNKIKRIKNAKKRLRDSGVSTEDAMEARKSPLISTGKDVMKISHQAGLEAAKQGALFSGGFSTVNNLIGYMNNEKSGEEAIVDIATDMSVGAVKSYGYGAVNATFSGALKNSGNQICKNLSKGNTPLVILQMGVSFGNQITKLLSSELDALEFSKNITKEGTILANSLIGSNVGAAFGTMIAPGAGTVVGGVIGGMTASIMSSTLFSELKKSQDSLKASNERREEIEKLCKTLIKQEREYRNNMISIYEKYLNQKEEELRKGFGLISLSIQNGKSINEGLSIVARAFDLEIRFKTTSDFINHINRDETLKL